MMNTWAIAWVAHELPRDPLNLFNANIFYPERLTLAFSEAMIPQGVLATPIIAAGGSPVLAFNLVLLAGFALTGWAFCVLLHRWTGSWGAGYISGSLAAFNSHVLVRLTHMQTLHLEFIAVMLFALDRLIVERRVRDALLLAIGFALQALTSIYLMVFSVLMLVFAALARASEWVRRDPVRMIGLFIAAGATADFLLVPYLLAYNGVHHRIGGEWSIQVNQMYAGTWRDYLSTGARMHFGWSERFIEQTSSAAFPGIVGFALALLAFAFPGPRRDRRVQMCAAAAVGCAAISLTPRLELFPAVYAAVPLFRLLRVWSRLDLMVLLMLAVMAGFGAAGLQERWGHARRWPVLVVALCAAVNLEALRAPLGYRIFTGVPPIYDVLGRTRGAVVAELPFFPPQAWFGSAPYMLNATRHWHPILNGYSSIKPDTYDKTYDALKGFPDVRSLTALHERGVTHVVVHTDDLRATIGADRFDAIAGNPSLSLVAADGDIQIYRLR